jgi:hypothetical protein
LRAFARLLAIVASCCALSAAREPVRFADAKARDVFTSGRSAIARGDAWTRVRALVFKGRLRVADGDDDVDGTVELRIQLPDKFLRVESVRGAERRTQNAAEFTRLMLGIAAYPMAASDLTIRSTGEEAFPETVGLDVNGKGFSARLVFDAESYVPLRLVYFGDRRVSTVVSFADRRAVDGIALPHRIATRTMQRVLETLMFDDVAVNPPMSPADFKIR